MRLRPLVFVTVLVVGVHALQGQEATDRYLEHPYVAAEHLANEIDAELFAQYKDLANRLVAALNARSAMDDLDSLFLTDENADAYLAMRFEDYDDLTEEAREDETSRARSLIDENADFWGQIIAGSAENGFTYALHDFGVYLTYETSHYFLISLEIEQIPQLGPLQFLAEFINEDLHISGLGIVPFIFR